MKENRPVFLKWFLVLLTITGILFLLDLILGSVKISIREIFSILLTGEAGREEWLTIVMEFRLPKALTAIIAGMALSVSGLQMQTIFRNPLAGPYVLGISAGASLGVALLLMGFSGIIGYEMVTRGASWAMAVASWLGSGLILLLIFAVSLRVKDIMTVLILGILFGSATTAVVSILQYFTSDSALKAFIVWTMGSLGSVTGSQLSVLVLSVFAGLVLAVLTTKPLNALLVGEQYARTMGMNVRRVRFLIFLSTSIMAGSVTAFCGPIGFIGIVVPHLARMIFQTTDHRYLIPATMAIGAIIVLTGDIISQLPGSDRVLPINAITALVGIPIVVWVIIKNRKIGALT
jgi:iron complex transport system permease protein